MNLFIDTNIYLSFYHFTNDDLEELQKLVALVCGGAVNLLLPEQVVNEFTRNRANKIADALKRLREQRLSHGFPQLCKGYEEYENLVRALQQCEKSHARLLSRLTEDGAQGSLKADAIIQELFKVAKLPPTSSVVVDRARLRMDLGNPPGKKGSLGDAVIWETLLEVVAKGEDLYLVCGDNDYFSPLGDDLLDPYLLQEWSTSKGSQLWAYRRLSSFFADKFPNIKLASQVEAGLLIAEFANSSSFGQTHNVIAKLSKLSDLTPEQVNEIVAVAVTNRQVYWIAHDPDVKRFLSTVVSGREDQIDPDNLRRIQYVLEEMEPFGEIPTHFYQEL